MLKIQDQRGSEHTAQCRIKGRIRLNSRYATGSPAWFHGVRRGPRFRLRLRGDDNSPRVNFGLQKGRTHGYLPYSRLPVFGLPSSGFRSSSSSRDLLLRLSRFVSRVSSHDLNYLCRKSMPYGNAIFFNIPATNYDLFMQLSA